MSAHVSRFDRASSRAATMTCRLAGSGNGGATWARRWTRRGPCRSGRLAVPVVERRRLWQVGRDQPRRQERGGLCRARLDLREADRDVERTIEQRLVRPDVVHAAAGPRAHHEALERLPERRELVAMRHVHDRRDEARIDVVARGRGLDRVAVIPHERLDRGVRPPVGGQPHRDDRHDDGRRRRRRARRDRAAGTGRAPRGASAAGLEGGAEVVQQQDHGHQVERAHPQHDVRRRVERPDVREAASGSADP